MSFDDQRKFLSAIVTVLCIA